jgi:hypothetical protein
MRSVQCEPNPNVGTKRKKEILVSSINEKKEILVAVLATGTTTTTTNQSHSL